MLFAVSSVLAGAGVALGSVSRDAGPVSAQQPQLFQYRLALPGVARDGASPVGQDQFVTSATATYANGKVNITARVRPTVNAVVVVDVEIYGPDGVRVGQEYYDQESFKANVQRSFPVSWTPPANLPAGEYRVKVGIFAPGPEWETLYHWNDTAATVFIP